MNVKMIYGYFKRIRCGDGIGGVGSFTGLALVLALALSSCSSNDGQTERNEIIYFDVKSFVTEQIALMENRKPQVVKLMSADGKSETKVFKEIPWGKELELFVQADINKPAYRSSYNVDSADKNHLQYSLKAGENLPVQKLIISLDSIAGKPKLIQAVLQSENRLYHSEKKIELRCAQVGSSWMVRSYRIAGYQKLSFMKKRNFEIAGTLR